MLKFVQSRSILWMKRHFPNRLRLDFFLTSTVKIVITIFVLYSILSSMLCGIVRSHFLIHYYLCCSASRSSESAEKSLVGHGKVKCIDNLVQTSVYLCDCFVLFRFTSLCFAGFFSQRQDRWAANDVDTDHIKLCSSYIIVICLSKRMNNQSNCLHVNRIILFSKFSTHFFIQFSKWLFRLHFTPKCRFWKW